MSKNVLIIGGGFAGVNAALAAARELDHGDAAEVRITLVDPGVDHVIRPRLYEADLDSMRVPLDRILGPVGVHHVRDAVARIDPDAGVVITRAGDELPFDALVLAAGSAVRRPKLFAEGAVVHDIDTLGAAQRLAAELSAREARGAARDEGVADVVVVGAGFTGLELATELAGGTGTVQRPLRVLLVDRSEVVAPEFGPNAREQIEKALDALGVERVLGKDVAEVTSEGVRFADGDQVTAGVVVWTAGPAPSSLVADLGTPLGDLGRVAVDENLAARPGIFAAGDVAAPIVDGEHVSSMSCQHARPQGRVAGANAVRFALGKRLGPYRQPLYITCLDLGAWGALVTNGFERDEVLAAGAEAKAVKHMINRSVIYPPLDGGRDALLAAGRREPQSALYAWLGRRTLSTGPLRRAVTTRAPDRAAALTGQAA